MKRLIHLAFLVLISALPAFAQQSPQQQAPPCSDEAYRQFDFWIGEWNVTDPQGNVAGENSISRILGGCVLHESWTSAGSSMKGESFNIYDSRSEKWHQTWVDTNGTLLLLDGGLVDGDMVLSGERTGPDGKKALHRITYTPNEDGSVRQHWEMSRDGGSSWSTLFDGKYVKKS